MVRFDIILVSAEPYVDHPFSGIGILKRVLEDNGFTVGIIETPRWDVDDDFLVLGKPNLFFGISSGAMDSMLVNYTPMKKKRCERDFKEMSYRIPDRAVIVYCNMIRKLFKGSKMVIGGTEASLRRFAHYDFWDNKIRSSILLDSRADILVFGYGELQILEIAKCLRHEKSIEGINGTCIVAKEVPSGFDIIPSFDDVKNDKKKFCRMQVMFDADKNIAQKFDNRYVLQYKAMQYTTKDLDYIYSLPYTRFIPKHYQEFRVVEYSVLTHRGCFGNCNFCSINANIGKKIISRSIESILNEIRKITKLHHFNGVIELSGASANMYGMDCKSKTNCKNNCFECNSLDKSHKFAIKILIAARNIKGVKQVNIKSGIRYDLALDSPAYIREIINHHIDKRLMIAPEHINKEVLELMNKKDNSRLHEFITLFKKISKEENKIPELSFYLMVGHPGCNLVNSKDLNDFVKRHRNTNFVQIFTPTPMSVSTCMYYTGINPKTMKPIYVPYSYNEKKKQKNLAMGRNASED